MISPLIRLFIREPELLADHLGAYLELARADLCLFRRRLKHQMMLLWFAAAGLLAGVLLTGVAVLLWAAQHEMHWVFFAVPLAPLILALACAIGLSRHAQAGDSMERFWNQVEADLKVLGRADDAYADEHGSCTAKHGDGGDASRS